MTAEEYFGRWMKVIDINEMSKVLNALRKVNHDRLCPEFSNIFRAFELCKYDDCKVVFLSKDPYPQKEVATGLAFGNKISTKALSPSLEVLKECCINYEIPHGPIDFDITLESWAKQGVLLLNSALTCETGKIGSHINMWRQFIAKLLKNLSIHNTGLYYVLFGSQAQTFTPYISKDYNTIVEVKHPAYYARMNQTMPYNIFTDINKYLEGKYGTAIEWYHELNNLNISNNERKEINDYDFFWPCSL